MVISPQRVDWIIRATTRFDDVVSFYRDTLGLRVGSTGPAMVDLQFVRYATFAVPGGVTLEVVEPRPDLRHLHDVTIVCIAVDDYDATRAELEARGQTFLTDTVSDGRLGWAYVQAPDGAIYQIYGQRSRHA